MSRRRAPLALAGLACLAVVAGAATWIHSWSQSAPPTDSLLPPLIDDGFGLVYPFTPEIHDTNSLGELQKAIQARGPNAMADLEARLDSVQRAPSPAEEKLVQECRLKYSMGVVMIFEGRFDEAASTFEKVLGKVRSEGISHRFADFETQMHGLLGVISLRQGEIDNCLACLGPSSCILPIVPQAVHKNTDGSRAAVRHFNAYLQAKPDDLRVRWLLNVAYMTLGEYPQKVPSQYLIPLDTFRSPREAGRFKNVAPLVGLTSRGPNLAGGSVFDDFTGDGLPDVFSTSFDFDKGASLYVNLGDGTFEDRSAAAGLTNQVYALNVARADFDNDGNPDVVLLRGAWETPKRLSLLRNKGNGVFEDVTVAAGMATPIATESAAWGDFDNDGLIDLFVCGEYFPPSGELKGDPDPRNRCRLYRNQGNGTFIDVAAEVGVLNEQCAKGCAWGDYDGDGWPDLFVSNMNGPCRLYHNEHGKFRDVAPELGITGPELSFACWFWDFDNDGRLDLYVNNFAGTLAEFADQALGKPVGPGARPRLYRNLGAQGFRDVAEEVGLKAMFSMGGNFGDIDNDGYLDVYLGTGRMTLDYLVPNVMWKNVEGKRFEDVTMSSGTGHLQKGHGISFADWNGDGALDLFVEVGGGIPGDKSYNLLFQNPGHGRHWLKVKLVGTKTNRSALGAQIQATVRAADGKQRSIYRTIGNNSSFGGNSLAELIGLLDSTSIEKLEVHWPTSRTTQVFRDVAADRTIEITEGIDAFKVLRQSSVSAKATSSAQGG